MKRYFLQGLILFLVTISCVFLGYKVIRMIMPIGTSVSCVVQNGVAVCPLPKDSVGFYIENMALNYCEQAIRYKDKDGKFADFEIFQGIQAPSGVVNNQENQMYRVETNCLNSKGSVDLRSLDYDDLNRLTESGGVLDGLESDPFLRLWPHGVPQE